MNIKIDLGAVESMLVFWTLVEEREKVSDRFLHDIAEMPQFQAVYDAEFGPESLVKVLSAVSNRELLNGMSKKEGRFWNNNLWILENPGMMTHMAAPLKTLNLTVDGDGEQTVVFVPMTTEESFVKEGVLYINFFRVMAGEWVETPTIEGLPIGEYILSKLA